MSEILSKAYYLKKADENLPKLHTKAVKPKADVNALCDGDSIILDLGSHYVGFLSFTLGYTGIYPDAPVRLRVKFCESEDELSADFSDAGTGLCASWLQEEIINVDFVGEYNMPRRYAARYIKITVVMTPRPITLSDFIFKAVTSADGKVLVRLSPFEGDLVRIDKELIKIDEISVNTLKNCMQRVFEDGPKRDRRLWIGDLRLEALTNYRTFKQNNLVRRCLYLFAAATVDDKGFLPGYVYENPKFVSGYWHLRDYALLFVVTLCDYYLETYDKDTFFDIYPVACGQMDAMLTELDGKGIAALSDENNIFIDWCPGLKKVTSLHGVYMYTLKILSDVLESLGHSDAQLYKERYLKAKDSALRYLYNRQENNFSNKFDDYQLSVHSAVWMILAGVIEDDKAWSMLQSVLSDGNALTPVTPYMHHYLVEAMMKLGRVSEAFSHIKDFWGLMTSEGADTFYEVFVPGNPDASPYGSRLMNSRCHAWSCTPSYFIRKEAYKNQVMSSETKD